MAAAAIPIAASVAGAAASSMMNGSPSGSTTTTNAPWSGQAPYLTTGFQGAGNLLNQFSGNPSSLFTAPMNNLQNGAQSVAGRMLGGYNPGAFSNGLNMAMGSASGLAQNGGNVSGNNVPGLDAFANGGMLNNPYMQSMADQLAGNMTRAYQTATAPQITSEFERAGRYGSGAMANAQSQGQQDFAQQLGGALGNLYGSMYQQNMGNMLNAGQSLNNAMLGAGQANQNAQLSAIGMTPNLESSLWSGLSGANQLGTQLQGYNQQVAQSPLSLLQAYQGLVGGQQYGSQTTTPYFTNPGAGMLGGALLGQQIVGGLMGGGGGSNYLGTGSGYNPNFVTLPQA